MRVLVTGANGFVGRELVAALCKREQLAGRQISRLLLVDRSMNHESDDSRIRIHTGNIADPRLLRRVLADGVDVVFHLASVPGGAAEQDYEAGYKVNLLGSQELIDQLRQMQQQPRLVFASSIAVYGESLDGRVTEASPVRPNITYGTHKRVIELLIQDLVRRGELNGCAVRLPGVVARFQGGGFGSAFMSDLLTSVARGESYTCPVSEQAATWWISLKCCVDNLIRLAEVERESLKDQQVVQMPLLHLSIDKVMDALAKRYGSERRNLVTFKPDPRIEGVFGQFPPLKTPQARALGLRHDGNAHRLVRNALRYLDAEYPPKTIKARKEEMTS